jgi:hypothetical protein
VTVLRSPSSTPASTVSAGQIAELLRCFIGAAVTPFTATPQFPQNFAVGAFSNPHDTHGPMKAAPHSLQNFNPSGFSVLHFAQIMTAWLGAQLIEQLWRLSDQPYRRLQ